MNLNNYVSSSETCILSGSFFDESLSTTQYFLLTNRKIIVKYAGGLGNRVTILPFHKITSFNYYPVCIGNQPTIVIASHSVNISMYFPNNQQWKEYGESIGRIIGSTVV